jgi:predicted dehydrogenase
VYAHHLAKRVPEARLTAVADTAPNVPERIAQELDLARWYADPLDLLDDPHVDAVVIVTPTDTHRTLVIASLERGKPTFCEKPPALSLADVTAMRDAASRTAVPLHVGFMRRFDPGYAAAKRQVDDGAIGRVVLFKACSRDPFPPSAEYANPRSSGGLLVDMGIHDFDLARWFMGDVQSVYAVGGVLAYPELGAVGDIDNAVVSLQFRTGTLGVVDLTRNGIYGYDITTDLLGTSGTLRIGYLRETPLLVMTAQGVTHDTVPYFMQRFEQAYVAQLRDFVAGVLDQRAPSVTIDDGLEALKIGLAATRSREIGQPVSLDWERVAP